MVVTYKPVSYTHLAVEISVATASEAAKGLLKDNETLASKDIAPLPVFTAKVDEGKTATVSYTHLDVYKRQPSKVPSGRRRLYIPAAFSLSKRGGRSDANRFCGKYYK